MTMHEIKLPNGSIASFPDMMCDAEIEAVLRARFPMAAPPGRIGRFGQSDALISIVPPEECIDFFTARRVPRVLRRALR